MLPLEIVNWEPNLVEKNLPLAQVPDPQIGYLLVGHGTRRTEGQKQFRDVFTQFAEEMAPHRTAMAFLELAEPDIPTAIEKLARQGIRRLRTVPVLLFEAGHALEDIPQAVELAADNSGLEVLGQTGAFQCCAPILQLSAHRFRETVCTPQTALWLKKKGVALKCDNCQQICSGGPFCSMTALLMVGRGSSSESATQSMREFTDLRRQATQVAWSQTAFIHGQKPDLDSGLEELAKRPEPIKIVQPHLIFEGLLSADLNQRVKYLQSRHPDQLWLMPGVLGDDRELARTLADIAKNTK